MIEVKTFFHDWKEVSKEQAQRWVKYILNSGNAPIEQRKEWLKERIKGIELKELME